MGELSGYTTTTFSPTQKFIIFDVASGTTKLILGSDLVNYISPNLGYVRTETTRAAAQNTDYSVGVLIQTAGGTAIGDGGNGMFLVVAGGSGDYAMLNGNDLLLLPFGSLSGSNLDGGLVTVSGTPTAIETEIASINTEVNKRSVSYSSILALVQSSDSYDYVSTDAFTAGGSVGGCDFYKSNTGQTQTTATTAAIITALATGKVVNAAGVEYSFINQTYTFDQGGAISGSTSDQLTAIQAIIDGAAAGSYFLVDQEYWVDSTANAIFQTYGGVIPLNNQTIEFVGNGALQSITNAANSYSLFQGYNVSNLQLKNPRLIGDLSTHTGTTGETGNCIFLITPYNLKIIGGDISEAWGDGITIQAFAAGSTNALAMPADYVPGNGSNVQIIGVYIHNCRRQGISIIGCDDFIIANNIIRAISGTDPAAGIDCEPDTTTNTNGLITGNQIEGTNIGVMTSGNNEDILIAGNSLINVARGVQVGGTRIKTEGNYIYVKTSAASLLNGAIVLKGGIQEHKNNYCVIDSSSGNYVSAVANGATCDTAVIEGNTFIFTGSGAPYSSTVAPCTNKGIFRKNTIIIESDFDPSNLSNSTLFLFYGSTWDIDDNVYIDKRTSGTAIRPFDAAGGASLPKRGHNTYIGYAPDLTGANDNNSLNHTTYQFTGTSSGAKSGSDASLAIDVSSLCSGTTIKYFTFSTIGGGENSEDPSTTTGTGLASYNTSTFTFTCRNSGSAFQTVKVFLNVTVEGRVS